jgi:hypothetical protein
MIRMYRQILSDLGSYASLISLALTVYIAWNVRNIKNKYIFRIKAPQFVKTLTKRASTLIEYTNDFQNNKREIGDELTLIDVKLKGIQGRMRGESKKAVKDLRARIREYEREPDNEAKIHLIYRWMQRVIEEVKEYQEYLDLE